jgi:hypothetical protein
MRLKGSPFASACALLALLVGASLAAAATPSSGTLRPDSGGQAQLSWEGEVSLGSEVGASDQGEACFGTDGKPDPASGCDFFSLTVDVAEDFYKTRPGAVSISVTDFGLSDLDLYVYEKNDDGTVGEFVIGDGQILATDEAVGLESPVGAYYVVVTPYTPIPDTTYKAEAKLVTREQASPAALNKQAPIGFPNHRASRDRYTSHSEPTIAMDPLDHNHLMAASKMYENNAAYLFKVGTYESLDGGRTWRDLDQLPGYCTGPGECDPNDEARYRVTSDPTLAFDDEGNAYANVLDALGGTFNFRGFNMTAHVKPRGQPWSNPIVVHDNRTNALTESLFLDDKNWIAVDNVTDTGGGPNRPNDGKIGTAYICWSFDGTSDPTDTVPLPIQQIVMMRSTDGGRTWGGYSPGDNTPQFLSLKTLISGIGCHISIGPAGEVYVTWYDNQLDALMQVKSTNRGQSWSLPLPIANIVGVNEPFEGQTFRNLSIPATAVDKNGHIYVVVSSRDATGTPVQANARELMRKLKAGKIKPEDVATALVGPKANNINKQKYLAKGDGEGPGSGADIVMFKSTDGGESYSGPIRVNQDPRNGDADQFQPWIAVTDSGQINVSYFDRRHDPQNFFIDTYLSRSNDGGSTWHDTRVSHMAWDPSVNAPTSVSGKFIGDYQGLVADDNVAIPFWQDTQLDNLPETDRRHSPYQEVFAARVPNSPASFISRPTNGSAVSRRGLGLTIRGVANDPSGGSLKRIRLAVKRQRGRRCWWYSRGRFARGSCSRPRYLRARGTARWRAQIRRRALARGFRYYVLSSATNTTGKAERSDEPGRNQVRIRVK